MHISPINIVPPFTLEELSSLQSEDEICSEAINWILEEILNTTQLYCAALKNLFDCYQSLNYIDNILYLDLGIDYSDLKLVISLLMQPEVVRCSHVYLTRHFWTYSMLSRLRQTLYWLTMRSDVSPVK